MALKVLNIVDNAYRCTIEEQDDPVLWITGAMKGAGANLAVLLRGNAVNYAVKAQNAGGLSFGDKKQTQPPDLAKDVVALIGKGVDVYLVEDDVAERGLERNELVEGLKSIPRSGAPGLLG